MSNYLLRLAARSMGILDVVSFRTPSLFEPQPQFQPPPQNGSIIQERMTESIPFAGDDIYQGRSKESPVADDLTINSPFRKRKSAFSFRSDQSCTHVIPGIFAPNSSGRHKTPSIASKEAYPDDGLLSSLAIQPMNRGGEKESSDRQEIGSFKHNELSAYAEACDSEDAPKRNDEDLRISGLTYLGSSASAGDGLQLSRAQLSARLYPEEQEAKQMDENLDSGLIPADLPALSIFSNPRASDILKNTQPSEGNSEIIRSALASEAGVVDSGSFVHDKIIKMEKDLRGSQMDEASQIPEDRISASYVSKNDKLKAYAEACDSEDAPKRNDEDLRISGLPNPGSSASAGDGLQLSRAQLSARLYPEEQEAKQMDEKPEGGLIPAGLPAPSRSSNPKPSDILKNIQPSEGNSEIIRSALASETGVIDGGSFVHDKIIKMQKDLSRSQMDEASQVPEDRTLAPHSSNPDSGPNSSSSTIQPIQRESKKESSDREKIVSFKHDNSSAYAEASDREDVPKQNEEDLRISGFTNPGRSASTGNALQFRTAHLSARLYPEEQVAKQMDEKLDDGLIPVGFPAPSRSSNPRPFDILKNIQRSEVNSEIIRPVLASETGVVDGGSFVHDKIIKMQKDLSGSQMDEASQVTKDGTPAPHATNPDSGPSAIADLEIYDHKVLDFARQDESRNPEALQFRIVAERESGAIGHESQRRDQGFAIPDRSAAAGNAIQFKSAHLPTGQRPEMQEAELDSGLIPAKLPAPSRSSSPKSTYIPRKFGNAVGNFIIIRPGLASEPGEDNHRKTAPSIGKLAAFKGAPPAEKDRPGLKKSGKIQAIFHPQRGNRKTPPVSTIYPAGAFSARPDISEGGVSAYPETPEMQAALGGTGIGEPSQVPANLILASQVSNLHVSAIRNSGSRVDPSIFSSPDVPLSNGALDLIDAKKILNFHQAGAARRALSKWKVTPQQNSAPSSSAYEDIALLADRSFFGSVRQAEPGWTANIGDGHAVSDEIRLIREGRRSRDSLERLERLQGLQNGDREKEMFGARADSGRESRIKVTIGRIDVRAEIAPVSKETKPGAIPASRSAPRLTLDGYLKQRNEGRI